MRASNGLRFLRPYLLRELCMHNREVYIRFFSSTQRLLERDRASQLDKQIKSANVSLDLIFGSKKAVVERVKELKAADALKYPRVENDGRSLTCAQFLKRYAMLADCDPKRADTVKIRGRIQSVRVGGKGLVFIDISQDGVKVQVVCNLRKLEPSEVSQKRFSEFYHLIRRGDIISISGQPYHSKDKATVTSIVATELPIILAPSLPNLPTVLEDPETRIRNRHVDLLVNKSVADTIRLRSHIIRHVRDFLLEDGFLEVQTPIIADSAGGAIARPFTTCAAEFPDKQLALRIAPELWLKRLILGGIDRVFEIGQVFRNEGLDSTHNPEFMICEFYQSFAELEEVISMTMRMIRGLAVKIASLDISISRQLAIMDPQYFKTFRRLQFIPTVEDALGEKLPDLAAIDATEKISALFEKHEIQLPASPSLPRLLDKLSSVYIEPQCTAPTFIVHHPSCLAPLAKSFLDPATRQIVSARAELFIQNREIANMYEEENSPFEQRAKFLQQAEFRDDENTAVIDESYLEALGWGLPPTGGWGCGLDRLVMLFSGSSRISDVLSFGNLRNVVHLGNREKA